LNPQPGGSFIDSTFGGGGHTQALLDRTSPDGRVLALDQDETTLVAGRQSLASYGSRLDLVKVNFREISRVADERGFRDCDGILADIGVSSMMLDDPARGFSFMREGPLDMRMDTTQSLTAAAIVNTASERELADIFYSFGEERRSRAIARAIVRNRPLATTTDLAAVVERVMGRPRFGQIHPATRTFQALRIAVNDELESLNVFVDSAMSVVRPGGRVVVITFHSLEDRIVKNKFRTPSVPGTVLTRKVVTAAEDEVRRNSRARSAKLRAWEKK
jgi:16S rRNA (cytosine1402-N4)-methyltransferase